MAEVKTFDQRPPSATLSGGIIPFYGKMIRSLRGFTNKTANEEPRWRHTRPELTTGYRPRHYGRAVSR